MRLPQATRHCTLEEYLDVSDPKRQTAINPVLILEVLLQSTEAYDPKFENYQTIESLKEYVLISQEVIRVETFARQSDQTWLYSALSGLDAFSPLSSIGVQTSLRALYEEVPF